MAADPRLDSLMQYAMSVVADGPTDETAGLRQRVETLERVLAAVLRTPNVQVWNGPPSGAARDGTLAVDRTNRRLYVMATTWGYLGPLT